MTTHIPWDGGAINAAFKQVLGVSFNQKTTKTLCEKRVPMHATVTDNPTCQHCQAIQEHNLETIERLKHLLTP